MPTTEEQNERRLAREAQERIGTLSHPDIPNVAGQSVRVEVSYQRDEDELDHAGHFLVVVPYGDDHPADIARDLVQAYMNDAWSEYVYTSIDDVLGL